MANVISKKSIIFIAAVVLIVLLIVIFITTAGKQDPLLQAHERVVNKLENNDFAGLYDEMSPSLKDIFTYDSFVEDALASHQSGRKATKVAVISKPSIKTEDPWNSEWADSEIQMVYPDSTINYLVRFHFEEGQWWLFGTLEIE